MKATQTQSHILSQPSGCLRAVRAGEQAARDDVQGRVHIAEQPGVPHHLHAAQHVWSNGGYRAHIPAVSAQPAGPIGWEGKEEFCFLLGVGMGRAWSK